MPTGPTRADTFTVTVSVQDIGNTSRLVMMDCGIWDKRGGGAVDSEEARYNPGGMAPAVSLGGRKTVENVTVSRLYRIVRDHTDLTQRLISGVGRAKMEVRQLPMEITGGESNLRQIIWTGTLKRVTVPEHDSESSDAALMELEMTVEGEPVVQ
jgi:hypothetical protein